MSSQKGTNKNNATPQQVATRYYVFAAIVLVIGVAAGIAVRLAGLNDTDQADEGITFKAIEGIGVFAILYVLAQSIERIIEIVFPFIDKGLSRDTKQTIAARKVVARTRLASAASTLRALSSPPMIAFAADSGELHAMNGAGTSRAKTDMETAESDAEKAQKDVKAASREQLLAGSALGFALAFPLVTYFQFSLVEAIGFSGAAWWVGTTITALAIIGGSSALHDFISRIQAAKEQSETPAA